MTARQRVAMAFVARGDEILLVQRPSQAGIYSGRWTTVSGPIEPGETPAEAAGRAIRAELSTEVMLGPGGLAVDFVDTIRKKTVAFRIYPFLATAPEPGVALVNASARWATFDDVMMASALGETVPELDEALARVWNPPEQLPPLYRADARVIFTDRLSSSRVLAARAAALVARAAPPERVAALRPARARVVAAARAAARPSRDVPRDLELAAHAEQTAVASATAGIARIGAVGPVPLESRAVVAWAHDQAACFELAARAGRAELGLILLAAESVLPRGDVVVCRGAAQVVAAARDARIPVVACADAWAAWSDELPPPLEPELELIAREQLSRVIGAAN